jgi:tetratricopeptide (TPR) repeat protein
MLFGSAIFSHAAETNAITPVTARDFYNAGTQMLGAKKFAPAEEMFDAALAAQDERVQPRALYNLGHTRFADGAERLKQGPDAQTIATQGDAALAAGGNAIRSMGAALMDTNLTKLVAAYREGRGARRRVRDAEKAVQAAMQAFGYTLRQWERAMDDFNSAAELHPADTNAAHNAEIVKRAIARLVDTLQAMQQMGGQLGDQKQQLDQLGSKLKGRIPAPDAPPGGYGEDEEEGVQPESLAGQKENAPHEGGEEQQIGISPDLAKQMLDGMSPGGTRLLPLSDQQTEPPRERTGRNW